MKPCIVFTGGGTAGHVLPNLALIEALQEENWQIAYIGSAKVEEKIMRAHNIPYYAVVSGKLRRYFSWKNFLEPWKVLFGIGQAYFLLRKTKADLVFSKGGFVAFPVVVAAWLNRIPVIAHESDISPGLANRLSFPFVNKICLTFSAAKKYFRKTTKIVVTGTPIRQQLFKGSKARGLALCDFHAEKPCLLVMGGSQGSASLNNALRKALASLCQHYQVIHLCGQGKLDDAFANQADYCQLEYADTELPDLFAASDIVISRAGANTLYEILALEKPHVLVPLSEKVSRGDQVQNATYFQQHGVSQVIKEEELSDIALINAIQNVSQHKEEIIDQIKALHIETATAKIIGLIKEQIRVKYPKIA